jgi:hypothetical protein
MRRLDQGISQIAKLPLTVSKLELRGLQRDTRGRFRAHPAMHVVIAEIIPRSAEISAAARPERYAHEEQQNRGE